MLTLPGDFTPTHPTAGLEGYPAIDCFAPAGSTVVAGFYGRVRRISGRPCSSSGVPGGAYGRSVYILNHANGIERYVTHLDELELELGERVGPGKIIGTVCRSPAGSPRGSDHVHLGMHRP